jgi:hypothetical protein
MSTLSPLAYSLRSWFWQACAELTKYFEQMTVTQYAILATATVAFGFLCLKGYTIRR